MSLFTNYGEEGGGFYGLKTGCEIESKGYKEPVLTWTKAIVVWGRELCMDRGASCVDEQTWKANAPL